jgi:hypothetical protein
MGVTDQNSFEELIDNVMISKVQTSPAGIVYEGVISKQTQHIVQFGNTSFNKGLEAMTQELKTLGIGICGLDKERQIADHINTTIEKLYHSDSNFLLYELNNKGILHIDLINHKYEELGSLQDVKQMLKLNDKAFREKALD